MSFFNSKGLKRTLVAYLAVAVDLLRAIPQAAPIVGILDTLIGLLGGVAVAHAGASGTLSKEKLAGAAAALYAVIALAPFFPVLIPYLPYLYKAVGLLGAARLGSGLVK